MWVAVAYQFYRIKSGRLNPGYRVTAFFVCLVSGTISKFAISNPPPILSINFLNWCRRPNREYCRQGSPQERALRKQRRTNGLYSSFTFCLFLNPMLDGSICPSFYFLVAGVRQRCGNNLMLLRRD